MGRAETLPNYLDGSMQLHERRAGERQRVRPSTPNSPKRMRQTLLMLFVGSAIALAAIALLHSSEAAETAVAATTSAPSDGPPPSRPVAPARDVTHMHGPDPSQRYLPPPWLAEAMERMDEYVVGSNSDLDVERIWEQSDPTPLTEEEQALVLRSLARKLEGCAELLAAAESGKFVDQTTGLPADPTPLRFAMMECEHQLAEFGAGRYRRSAMAGIPLRLRGVRTTTARLSEHLAPEIQSLLLFRIERADHPDMLALKDELLTRMELESGR